MLTQIFLIKVNGVKPVFEFSHDLSMKNDKYI